MGIDCETQKRTIREGKKCLGKQQWFVGMEGGIEHIGIRIGGYWG